MFLLRLEVTAGQEPTVVREFTINERGKIHIGRQDCELLLADRAVSRRHLGLAVKNGKLLAGDLGSSGGTLHNGRPLHRAGATKGDLFQLGACTIFVKSFELVEKPAFIRRLPNLPLGRALRRVGEWVQWLRPSTCKGWATSFVITAIVFTSLQLITPAPYEPENPFAPREAGFINLEGSWKSVRKWMRATAFALKKDDPALQEHVDYERIFEE